MHPMRGAAHGVVVRGSCLQRGPVPPLPPSSSPIVMPPLVALLIFEGFALAMLVSLVLRPEAAEFEDR